MDGGCCSKRTCRAGKSGAAVGARRAASRFTPGEVGA